MWSTGSGTILLEFERDREKCGLEIGLDAARHLATVLSGISKGPTQRKVTLTWKKSEVMVGKHPDGAIEIQIKRGSQKFSGHLVPTMAIELSGAIFEAQRLEQLAQLTRKGSVRGEL